MAAVTVTREPAAARAPQPQAAPSAADQQARHDARTLAWLRAGIVLSLLVPWIVFAVVAWFSHADAVEEAQRRMDRIAGIAHEHALKLFETTDLLVKQVNAQTQTLDSLDLQRRQMQLSEQLAALTHDLSQVHSVWILDEDGNALVSSRVAPLTQTLNFGQRAAFSSHRERAGQLIVMPSRRGAVTGELFFDLSRRREKADGSFNGMTMVGLYPSYFTSFYRDLAGSESGVVVTLVHANGQLIARWPEPSGDVPALAPTNRLLTTERGSARAPSTLDGVMRLGAHRRVGSYPAVVYAGVDESAALANWRRDMLVLAGFIGALSCGLALIGWQALRHMREHIEAARLLRQEAAERQRVEAALRQSQKLEAMGHLTGGVAHDFNNLLMVVNLNATLLRQRLRDPSIDKQLDAIERAVGAGKKLTRQLLAFSRRQPLLPRVIRLADLMPTLLDLIRPALGSQIELEGTVQPGTRNVRLDSGELELALINLAVNARDAMPEGGRVQLRVRNDGDMVELAFTDSGVGIAPQDIERVFEPFFTTKPVGSGTGLGLSQVYGLCARAGGDARVESQRGIGTTVILRFPAVDEDAAPGATPAAPSAPLEVLALRVLLVEDNGDIASATREVLQAAGCEVTHVPQPAAALATLADDADYDVVLSDIVMPGGMDGLQLAAEIRRARPQLPLVLMTGYAEKLGEAESQGLVVLPKPFDPSLLLRTLREQMQIRRGADILRA